MVSADEWERLSAENASLRERIKLLEEQVNFLGQHRTLAAGITGERLIALMTGGTLTPHTSKHDIDAGLAKVEVKFSKLSRPVATAPTLRWQWQKIFGQTGTKDYTHLLLVGESDPRFRQAYRDPSSPYVFFLVPFDQVAPLCVTGNPKGIVLNTNPASARGSSQKLFTHFQVTAQEIDEHYTIAAVSDA